MSSMNTRLGCRSWELLPESGMFERSFQMIDSYADLLNIAIVSVAKLADSSPSINMRHDA